MVPRKALAWRDKWDAASAELADALFAARDALHLAKRGVVPVFVGGDYPYEVVLFTGAREIIVMDKARPVAWFLTAGSFAESMSSIEYFSNASRLPGHCGIAEDDVHVQLNNRRYIVRVDGTLRVVNDDGDRVCGDVLSNEMLSAFRRVDRACAALTHLFEDLVDRKIIDATGKEL